MPRKVLVILFFAALMSLSPVAIRTWSLEGDSIQPVHVPTSGWEVASPDQADLDGDGVNETIELTSGRVSITTLGQLRWQSPSVWDVRQAIISDLNQDNAVEVVLLVWRPFKPWPVDQWLPSGGRITDFHNGDGESCHIILIGWHDGKFAERWAGSALAQPVMKMAAADLDLDGSNELVTLDTTYQAEVYSPASMLRVWEWNGFGFSLVSEKSGTFHDLDVMLAPDRKPVLVTP